MHPNLLIVVMLFVAYLAVKLFVAEDLLKSTLRWIGGLGPVGPLIFIGLYIVAPILFFPGVILSIGAGTVFGLLAGSIYVSIGATLGATCAFLVGRYVAREWIAAKLQGNAKFKAVDRAVAREGWKIVGLARLSPLFPFNLLNYAFGLTDISLRDYFFATWVGMIPGIVMYVYLGSLVGDIAMIGSRPVKRSSAQWAFEVVGFVISVAVTLYVTYIAGRALREKTGN
ncbi:MAG TPA: TVP38/TMEM64 family protein [Candidatus Binataceae bacterium]|nr:TVP38/TMEM64 family protein [Candidatus Binataceae bacterium]